MIGSHRFEYRSAATTAIRMLRIGHALPTNDDARGLQSAFCLYFTQVHKMPEGSTEVIGPTPFFDPPR
jgi:hypothetical protein